MESQNDGDSWFGSEEAKSVLPRPDELSRSHEIFLRRFAAIANDGGRETTLASTKEELIAQLEPFQPHDEDLKSRQNSAIRDFRSASAAHNAYATGRRRGIKQYSKWFVQHAGSLGEFVERYARIIETVASAGGPYGTVAYQTLSILLGICVNKVRNDNKIIDLLEQLRKYLPRLENWTNIYPGQVMRSLVACAYTLVTEFCRKSAEYLSKFSKRMILAALPFLASSFDEMAKGIHTTLAEINDEAMFGLHRRILKTDNDIMSSTMHIRELKATAESAEKAQQTLVLQNKELLSQNRELRNKLDQQSLEFALKGRQDDERRIQSFQNLLQVEYPHPGMSVSTTKDTLMAVFPDIPGSPSLVPSHGFRQMSRQLLYTKCPEYREWMDAPDPSILYISGSTDWHGRRFPGSLHSWLSPIAIYKIEELDGPNERFAFFSCLPNLESPRICPTVVISSIIMQVLKWQPEMLRDFDGEFRGNLMKADGSWSLNSLVALLENVLVRMETRVDGVGYIIIDRVDRCCGDDVSKFMEMLAGLVSRLARQLDHRFRIKILVIAGAAGGGGIWRVDWLSRFDYDLSRILECQCWDQVKLTAQESIGVDRPRIWDKAKLVYEGPD